MYEGWASIDQQQTYGTLVEEGDEGRDDDPSNPNSSSSSAGLLDWSSSDGFSSIGMSSLATADTRYCHCLFPNYLQSYIIIILRINSCISLLIDNFSDNLLVNSCLIE